MEQPGNVIAAILAGRTIYFDPTPENNGLYLCLEPAAVAAAVAEGLIARLGAVGAWQGEAKTVADQAKPAYAEQLAFEECFVVGVNGHRVLVLRAGNAKYPTVEASWEKWRACLAIA